MKSLKSYIQEVFDFKLGDDNFKSRNERKEKYKYFPKTNKELKKIIKERLEKDPNANLNDIDVSEITDMQYLFMSLDPHNIDISWWDMSNVKNMAGMFFNCHNFEGKGLENWDVSNVKLMVRMFDNCVKFDCDLCNWDVSGVENMGSMFRNCNKFNCDLSKWNVSNVEDMNYMFYNCKKFEGKGLEKWNVKNVKDMYRIFEKCNSLKNKPNWYK